MRRLIASPFPAIAYPLSAIASLLLTIALCMLVGACASPAPNDAPAIPAHGVIGVREPQLEADYWIRRQAAAQRTVLDARTIATQNERLQQLDPSLNDIENLPPTLTGARVKEWIASLSARPDHPMYDYHGHALDTATLDGLVASTALEAIPETQSTRYGMIVRRADLRTFPSRLRAFNSPDNADIDRFQETALFPGTPLAIVHASRDGAWLFAVSPLYAAWVEKDAVAEGSKGEVFAYVHKSPYLVITGAMERTVFTREQPGVSELQLEMGVRVPLLAAWPPDKAVNGQHPYAAHVIELPIRPENGELRFAPALLPKTADVATDYLALNRANLLRQSFKFLGERYGWGHSYNARDCSGFVSEVYRSFGVRLPRNTRDQGVSPALNRLALTPTDSHERRLATLRQSQVGDLIYIPGHVMMVIGHENGTPYVIHDTTGIGYRGEDGTLTRVRLNAVSVTPLVPLLLGEGEPMVDRITNILRIRP